METQKKSPKFNVGDKVVVIPEEAWKVDKDHRNMTLTVKETLPYGQFKVEEHTWLHHENNWEIIKSKKTFLEPGKIYKRVNSRDYYKCLEKLSTKDAYVMEGVHLFSDSEWRSSKLSPAFVVYPEHYSRYSLYVPAPEPKVTTMYVHWYKDIHGIHCIVSADNNPSPLSHNCLLKTDVITYKEEPK